MLKFERGAERLSHKKKFDCKGVVGKMIVALPSLARHQPVVAVKIKVTKNDNSYIYKCTNAKTAKKYL